MQHSSSVLFIHHCRDRGGASKSLQMYLPEFTNHFNPILLSPIGKVSDDFKKTYTTISVYGIAQFDNSEVGRYKGLRWLVILRELAFLIPSIYGIIRIKFKYWSSVKVIHLNEMSLICIGIIARMFFRARLVVHVRTCQSQKEGIRSRMFGYLLRNHADHIIAIDSTVKESLLVYRLGQTKIDIVRNSLSHSTIRNNKKDDIVCVGIVANFLEYKGILDFYNAAKLLLLSEHKDLKFFFFGDNHRNTNSLLGKIFKIFGYVKDLKQEIICDIEKHSLQDYFIFNGFTSKLDEIYSSIDILCFPSHLNAIGRPVIEASFYKIPSIASLRDRSAPNDYIIDGISGKIVSEKNYNELAKAILELASSEELRLEMGAKANELNTSNFSFIKNSNKFISIMQKQLGL